MSAPPYSTPRMLGRYVLYDEIASGGMATVHLGRLHGPVGFSRTVAIKRMHPAFARDPEVISMFLDEARLVARISHPNVVPTLDIIASGEELFIVMEYVRGESLARLIRAAAVTRSALPPELVATTVVGVLHGLHAAHEATGEQGEPLGIVHRDVSPQNILVGVDGVPRVLDFGVAKAVGRLQTTHEGQLKGKLGYMAPEQISGKDTSRATDVYAASVVLWEALTSERLFGGDNEAQVLSKILRGCSVPPSARAPGVPHALDAVALRGLSIDAADRYPTARDMALDLEKATPLMTASGVGAWVERVGKATLDVHRERIAAMESDSSRSMPAIEPREVEEETLVNSNQAVARRRRPRWPWAVVGLVGAALLGYAARSQSARRSGASPGPSASASEPAPRVTTLADLPPPATGVPEALAEYMGGIQALHDDSWGLAARRFDRAAALDPTLAIAHLRLSMIARTSNGVQKRDEFAKAVALRAKLTARDQALLEALEPLLQRVQEDPAEAIRRLERARETYPSDVELLDWLGILQAGRPEVALAYANRAIELDPEDGQAWQTEGESFALLGRLEEGRAALERCTSVAVDTADCLTAIARIDALEGRCDAYEADVRRWFDRDPGIPMQMAVAILARGGPVSSAREVCDSSVKKFPSALLRDIAKNLSGSKFSTYEGDFTRAEALARKSLDEIASTYDTSTNSTQVLSGLLELIEPLEETGKIAEMREAARGILSRSAGWNGSPSDVDVLYVVARLASGPRAEFERLRDAWVRDQLEKGAYPGFVWTRAYAATALTADEARAALEALPRYAPLSSFAETWKRHLDSDAYAGRTFLLAGRAGDAIPYLRRATQNCNGPMEPGVQMRAALDLGQALEATGDVTGACSAYRTVLDRWGHAKPRSVTAEKAKEQSKALACAR